jgi:hypothetical protein
MDKTKVVNARHEPFDVYIGRPSKWGNPFSIGKDGTRKEVIEKYRQFIREHPQILADIEELRGKSLGCYCSPLPCHGDVLVDLLENKLDQIFKKEKGNEE